MIKKEIIPFNELKYIHHISDIQIRNLKRHKEYEECFERTYEEVRKYPDNAVAYIGGDIAHSKTEMSPELVDQLSRLFKNLSDIVPTIIIAGNHDCNLNNRSRMDVLTPIVKNLNHPNLHYFKDSGIYKVADVSFVVWDVWDTEDDFILADDVDGDTKIVLFHGTVDKSETDLGFKLPSDVHIDKFKGYDMGLLGDIHKRQHLNKEETISYCGSLVQQNHGEGLDHGYLRWDVPSRKSTYVPIHNDYGYYTLDVDNGVVPIVDDMPKKARLRVRTKNTKPSQLKKVLSVIRSRYGIKEVVVTKTDSFDRQDSDTSKILIGDITDPNHQYTLIGEYLEKNYAIDEDTLIEVKKINEELNSTFFHNDYQRNIMWKLKTLKFNNMFSYGENNEVDFRKLDGIVGLFSSNASGKSALLDVLSFCLYDTSSRAFKAENVLNNKKNYFDCKVNFEIDDTDYFVERKAKKLSNGHVKVDVNFWMIDDAGDEISLNGDQRRTTNVSIRSVIGTYEDFVLTALSLQNNNTVFIDKTQRERKDLLSKFIGIGIFDELWKKANEEISDVSAVLRRFHQRDYDKELTETQDNLNQYTLKYDKLVKQKEEWVDEYDQLNTDIIETTKKLKSIDESAKDIDFLKDNKTALNELLHEIDEKLGFCQSQESEVLTKEKSYNTKVKKYVDADIDTKYDEIQRYEEKKNTLKIELDKLKIQVQHKLDKIEKLGNLTYDEDCDDCMSNPFTLDAIETEKSLQKDKETANQYVSEYDELGDTIMNLEYVREDKIRYDELRQNLADVDVLKNKIDSQLTLLTEKKNGTIDKINSNEVDISNYYKQEEDILFNKELEGDINELRGDMDNLSSLIDNISNDINVVHGDVKVQENNKNNILSTIKEVEELEIKYKAYEFYLNAVKRDGVPYELISKAIPTVEGAVNEILSQIVDFSVMLEMDGKNINCYIVYDDDNIWPIELTSGMEKFISSLAIRVGLINVCNIPSTNFLVIDEGFGNMDSDNLNSVYNLFQYLKSQFQFTMIVSHIEGMRDAVDTLLELKKEEGFSKINYL
jgi:DNA repair exonuclease SbcCD ATPase subunit